jgi:hypothetical protein
MKYLRNEDGIALVTALMFTLICLAMIMTLMYYVLTATKMSAAQKKYRNSLEASYGGVDFITKTVIPRLIPGSFSNYSAGKFSLKNDFGAANLNIQLGPDSALKDKLTKATGLWGGTVSKSVNPKISPDFVFTLKGQNTTGDFRVYSKIVDTIAGVGLIDASGIDYLDAGIGVAGASNSTQTPRTPNIYSVEVQGEAAVNPKEKAGLSVLYAY